MDLAIDEAMGAAGIGIAVRAAHEERIGRVEGVGSRTGGGIDRAHVVAEVARHAFLAHRRLEFVIRRHGGRRRVAGDAGGEDLLAELGLGVGEEGLKDWVLPGFPHRGSLPFAANLPVARSAEARRAEVLGHGVTAAREHP